MTASR
ncbi:hypothetical protein E2C01_085189 [Portunus trituberculatus]